MKTPGSVFVRRTKEYIRKHHLINPGDMVIAAVSAGSDSLSMLLVLAELRQDLKFQLNVAHFDHQLREESADEAKLVEGLCTALDVPFYLGTAPVRSLAKGDNLEAVARQLRYEFFRKVAEKTGSHKIATAHHGDDQCETLLMHLIRGCGLEGLSAISPLERDIIRPFLCFTKNEIMMFCISRQADYAMDESNFSRIYTRNRLRMEIIPQLEELNPRLTEAAMSTAEICRGENDFLCLAAQAAYVKACLPDGNGLQGKVLEGFHLAIQRRVLRLAYEQYLTSLGIPAVALSFEQTQRVLELKDRAIVDLPKRIWAYLQSGDILFSKEKPEHLVFAQELKIKSEGVHKLADWNWEYDISRLSPAESRDISEKELSLDCFLVPACFLDDLIFRTRRDGDYLNPTGMEGRKKVKNIFIDKKIPSSKRFSWPLLILKDQVIWIPGLRRGKMPAVEGDLILINCHPCQDNFGTGFYNT